MCHLEYGTSTHYEASAPCAPQPGNGSSAVAISAQVAGLAANTTYHFRVVASNAGGTTFGKDQTLRTLPLPPAVETGAGSAIGSSSATLNGTVNPEESEITTCRFEYGTSSSYGSTVACASEPAGSTPQPVSAAINGLKAKTLYHFRLVAGNVAGTTTGQDQTFKTKPNPPAVQTGAASGATRNSTIVTGTVDPEEAEVTSCEFEYGTSTAYGATASCASLPPATSSNPEAVLAALGGLKANTAYHYRLVSANVGGAAYGEDKTYRTLPNPPVVETTTASSATSTSATLNGTVNAEEGELESCTFEYGTSTSYGSSAPCSSSPSGSTAEPVSAAISGLKANVTYHFRLVAANAGGAVKGQDQTLKSLPNRPVVESASASAVTSNSATLNGSVNGEEAEVSDCHFEYGATPSYGASVPCSSLTGPGTTPEPVSSAIGALKANSSYHFRLVASNAGGTSYGADQTLSTLPNPPAVETGVPSSVTSLSATVNGTVNPEEVEVTECRFEYGTSSSYGSSVPCSSVPQAGSIAEPVSAAIAGLRANTTYHFRLVASNAGGTSYGGDQSLTTPATPPTVVTSPASLVKNQRARVNGTVNPNGFEVSDCHFEYGKTLSYGTSIKCTALPGAGTNAVPVLANITGLKVKTTYHVRLVATNAGGASYGEDLKFTTSVLE